MAANSMTLSDLQGCSHTASVQTGFFVELSCAAVDKISTDKARRAVLL